MIICCRCGEEKPDGEFYTDLRKSNGLTGHCKGCHSVSASAYYVRNKAAVDAKKKEWYEANTEYLKVYRRKRYQEYADEHRRYRESHAAQHRLRSKEQWAEIKGDPEKLAKFRAGARKRSLKWQVENPGKVKAYRIYRKALADGSLECQGYCEFCSVEVGLVGHHEDYSKPLEVIWLCGDCHRKVHRRYE